MRIVRGFLWIAPAAFAVSGASAQFEFISREDLLGMGNLVYAQPLDVDGDGDLDLVVPTPASASLALMANQGGGLLASAQTLPVGSGARQAAVGLVNSDSLVDLVVLNEGSNTVSVLTGLPGGGFTPQIQFPVGMGPRQLELADVNGDQLTDLVVSNSAGGTVSVLLNAGFGFAAQNQFGAGPGPSALEVGDFDGDGDLDLAVGNSTSSTVTVLVGNGTGSFGSPQTLAVGFNPWELRAVDLNGDGTLDLAVSNENSGSVSILFNVFGFSPAISVPVFAGLVAGLGVSDFDGDGDPDLAVAHRDLECVFIKRNDGTGSFMTGPVLPVSNFPFGIETGDLDGDGDPEVFAACTGAGVVSILRGIQADGFLSCSLSPVGGSGLVGPWDLSSGDFDEDGLPDLAVANGSASSVTVLRGAGDGTVLSPTNLPVGSNPRATATADFNGDGRVDVASVNQGSSTASVLINNGLGGFFGALGFAVGPAPSALGVGDFDSDGKPDLITANASGATLSVLLNGGFGFLPASTLGTVSNPGAIAVRDLDGDGDLDLAVLGGGPSTVAQLFVWEGTSFVSSGSPFPIGSGTPRGIVAHDFDQDGLVDLAAMGETSGGDVRVLLATAPLTFPAATAVPLVGLTGRGLAAADFDGDASIDLAVALVSNHVAMLRNLGDGTFAPYVLLGTGKQPRGVLPVDLNLDGAIDLAVGCETMNTVSTLTNVVGTPGLAIAGVPSLGETVTAVLTGQPGDLAFLFVSPLAGSTPVPGLGVIGIDTNTAIQIGTWTLAGTGAVTLPLPIPAGATSLVGQSVFFQGLALETLSPLAGELTPVRSVTVVP